MMSREELELKRREMRRRAFINKALAILAYKTGKYAEMCRAYVHVKDGDRWIYANPEMKFRFDSEMMPLLEQVCGSALGENPDNPNHPIRKWKEIRYAERVQRV